MVFDLDFRHRLTAAEVKALIGGKAANLAVMASELRLPVPPGFAITTRACLEYLERGWPAGLEQEIREHVRRMERLVGRRFGAGPDPLLVSVRSGAPVSMPGMMDTVLNLGLNDETAAALAAVSGDERFAADCYSRFQSLFTKVVGTDQIPQDPWAQLRAATEAVFRSWNSDRARAYRRVERIPEDLGTAVTVQVMVFGNRGADSGSGVLFTRDPSTGERVLFGDILFDAQGEDVVAGGHQIQPLATLRERLPGVAAQLSGYADVLERHYRDLCDIEFTIDRGKLWLLQVRIGKRSPQAALRMAVEMAQEETFPLSREEAVYRVAPLLAHPPTIWVGRPPDLAPIARGLPASPGLAWGEITTSTAVAERVAAAGRQLLLVRPQTSPEDVPAMAKAAGVLTSRGGLASHAAVVARGWAVPAVVGAEAVEVGDDGVLIGGRWFAVGELLSIDGDTGEVFAGRVPGRCEPAPEALTLAAWADEFGIAIGTVAGEDASGTTVSGTTLTGTGLDPAPDTETAPEQATPDDVVQCLFIKGVGTPDSLVDTLTTSPERTKNLLDQCVEAGLVEVAGGGVRLTSAGEAHAEALLRAEQRRWGVQKAAAALDAFLAIDQPIKDATTAWQLRPAQGKMVVNDHSDATYDASVLATLRDLHQRAMAWLGPIAPRIRRFVTYGRRLDRAMAAATGGDHRFVASPRVDSYHGIWFELHEDLIRLAGRTREDEVAAGRA